MEPAFSIEIQPATENRAVLLAIRRQTRLHKQDRNIDWWRRHHNVYNVT